MSYRFVKVSAHYPVYLDDYYSRNPGIEKLSYREQYDHIIADGFGGNFFIPHLKKLGVDAYEIIANADPLQEAWAREHGTQETGKSLLIEQLKQIKPDVVFFDNLNAHSGKFIAQVKEEVPSTKQIIGWCGFPYTRARLEEFKTFDYMLSNLSSFVSAFTQYGLRAYKFNHAFEKSLLPQIQKDNNNSQTDFLFAGSLFPGAGHHLIRKRIILELLNHDIDLSIHTSIPKDKTLKFLAKQCAYGIAYTLKACSLERVAYVLPIIKKASVWEEAPRRGLISKKLAEHVKRPSYGLNMFKALARAKIGFNIHIDSGFEDAGNMRLFEVTGVGTCLLTDHKENIRDYFEPDKEIVTYKSAEECIDKVKWLLDNPLERERIAKTGQNRTLRDHTYERRAAELDEIVRRMLT